MASASLGQLIHQAYATHTHSQSYPTTTTTTTTTALVPCSLPFSFKVKHTCTSFSGHRNTTIISKAAPGTGGASPLVDDDEDGVSLGTMKLPLNIDIPRFESLLFQWANSLCQGSNLPLPTPLKTLLCLLIGGKGFLNIWEDILALMDLVGSNIQHVYREKNEVADVLAKVGAKGKNEVYNEIYSLPKMAQTILHFDKMGLPTFRSK